MKSLKIIKAHYGKKNLNLTSIYSNIGQVYIDQGNLK
jgi:hypothetical protein